MRLIAAALVASAFAVGTGAGAAGRGSDETGTVHVVHMVQDGEAFLFKPATVTIEQGDFVKFIMVAGGPHNVAFDPEKIPDDVEPHLSANTPNRISALAGPLLMDPNDSYTMSFANIKPGRYQYFCMPHVTMGMVGTITVR